MEDPQKLRELAAWYREFAEKTGNPSNPSVSVTRTGSCLPSASARNNSKLEKPNLLEVKMMYLPEG